MNEALLDTIQLVRTAGIGPVAYRHLIARFGSARAALDAVPDLARRGGGRPLSLFARSAAAREAERVEQVGGRYLELGRGLYPHALAELDSAPPLLTVRGRIDLLGQPLVAIVGARNASAAACRFARTLAHDLGREQAVVVSGLARGIDSAAHDGAMESGTIAVIAGGLDIAYPPENAERQERIAREGLLVAEMPPGTEPFARHFPSRNRIIAGLAAGTVVVEAAPKSGSLITARLATEAGREVMAVPGSPLDPRAQGCNQLIRQGATLVQDARDVLEAIRPGLAAHLAEPPSAYVAATPQEPEADERAAILSLLGPVAVSVDELVRQSGAVPAAVQLVLLELDLAGRLDRHAGGRVSLAG